MISDEQRDRLMAAIHFRPTNPPTPRLTPSERDELLQLVKAGREEEAWAELCFRGNAAFARSLEKIKTESAALRQEAREEELHEAKLASALGRVDELLKAKRIRKFYPIARFNALRKLGDRRRTYAQIAERAAGIALVTEGNPRKILAGLAPELNEEIERLTQQELDHIPGATSAAVSPSTKDEPKKARRRTDNLKRAIFDAWGKGFPLDATASKLFDYLARKDDTGFIRGKDGDELIWENSSGKLSRTSTKAFCNRLPECRKQYKSSQ